MQCIMLCVCYVYYLYDNVVVAQTQNQHFQPVGFNWRIFAFGLNRLPLACTRRRRERDEKHLWAFTVNPKWLTGRLYPRNIILLTFSFPSPWPSATPSDARINPRWRLKEGGGFPNQRLIARRRPGNAARWLALWRLWLFSVSLTDEEYSS